MKLRTVLMLSVLITFAATPGIVASGGEEVGNVCVQDYQGGATCVANDVRIEDFIEQSILETCEQGTAGELEILFRVLVSAAGSPDRFDIGIFVDLSGGATGALTGDLCLHDYLVPPLTAMPVYGDANNDTIPDVVNGPWWDGSSDPGPDDDDLCGDIESNTQILKDLIAIRVPCVDNDNDGFVDLHGCASWDNNLNTVCSDVTGAFPGTSSKCSCTTINTTQLLPIPAELIAFEVE
jgi:hypothetical protein